MMLSLLPLLLTGAAALPSPSAFPFPFPSYQLLPRDTTNSTYNASLPNITIFATGGTIAGSASSTTQTTGYQAGALGVDVLIAAVPSITNISNVRGVQISNVGSQAVTPAILLQLTQQIQAELDSDSCQGVVVTHGTDTLEETAFWLDATLNSSKPVVLVGAMRPATAVSADGPMNLLEAVTLAASEKGRDRGVMTVLNDRIASAWYATKTNANALDTFKAHEMGFLGVFVNVQPVFYYPPVRPVGKVTVDVGNATTEDLPQVDILYGYQALNPQLAYAAVESGAKGLVLAGSGAGSWTDEGMSAVKDVVSRNRTKVVVSRRTMDGYVEPEEEVGIYGGGFLNPQKARVLLQLGLYAQWEDEEYREAFEFDGA